MTNEVGRNILLAGWLAKNVLICHKYDSQCIITLLFCTAWECTVTILPFLYRRLSVNEAVAEVSKRGKIFTECMYHGILGSGWVGRVKGGEEV